MQPNVINTLKTLLLQGNPEFWDVLKTQTSTAREFDKLFLLSSLRKKAHDRLLSRPGLAQEKTRLAILGGCSLYPFHELLEHFCEMAGLPCEIWLGDYDNYISEIMDEASPLYQFAPGVVLLIPSEQRCRYRGGLTDSRQAQHLEATKAVNSLLELVRQVHEKSCAEVIVSNYMLPARHDLGAYRSRTLGSDWTFRKWVNLELGLNAPHYLHICDLEFLAHRHGGVQSRDDRAWFESKQPCSSGLLVEFAREATHLIGSQRRAPKKVLVLDLDNTLWGGVVADDGLEGIVLGDTSPRGEAFKAFQNYIISLKQRGVLLAVCSKNDHNRAAEVFEKHPEMILRMEDIVSFKANWEPKSDNIRQMAAELNLGLDSFVFVDDNPAEIDIVRQFAPEVTTILLGPDASDYAAQLQDCRLFEPRNITAEDAERTTQYRSEVQRQALQSSVTDMGAYLESLEMEATISEFTAVDVPRLAQLINKSNQFNLTTRRRTEADLRTLMSNPDYVGFSVRLRDRFGDHGLISIVIGLQKGDAVEVDTWLMSCRVLKRQVEEEVLNELARVAKSRAATRLEGVYLPTAKNEMVRDFYTRMGFDLTSENTTRREFTLMIENFRPVTTKIKIIRRAYEPS
ncbi:HAD-IIIC family phosphatase [Pedosphaera parvula]|uniref:FkbH like protein n=1 Tax=Pedosphaera parvula (strain Ellin514) TaxID=320771 RepID=B9XSK8_PEDPL|nr:HAD-IIIC family phosphatase [Pedosphaera parvula]EEF57168.1 FkbH like protein [Pedosphaera parvula Ellin514]